MLIFSSLRLIIRLSSQTELLTLDLSFSLSFPLLLSRVLFLLSHTIYTLLFISHRHVHHVGGEDCVATRRRHAKGAKESAPNSAISHSDSVSFSLPVSPTRPRCACLRRPPCVASLVSVCAHIFLRPFLYFSACSGTHPNAGRRHSAVARTRPQSPWGRSHAQAHPVACSRIQHDRLWGNACIYPVALDLLALPCTALIRCLAITTCPPRQCQRGEQPRAPSRSTACMCPAATHCAPWAATKERSVLACAATAAPFHLPPPPASISAHTIYLPPYQHIAAFSPSPSSPPSPIFCHTLPPR